MRLSHRLTLAVCIVTLLTPFVSVWAAHVSPPDVYHAYAEQMATGHVPYGRSPVFVLPLGLVALALANMGAVSGVSFGVVFVTLMLAFDAFAKWQFAQTNVERPLPFWLALWLTTICLPATAFAQLDILVCSLSLMTLVAWSRAPERATGWIYLSLATGVGVTPLVLWPVGAVWCRERGARWLDVTSGMCIMLIGIALPLMVAGLVGHKEAFVWWQALLSDGFAPASSYAAIGYLAEGLQGRFAVIRSFGQWITTGERALAWSRLSPLLLAAGLIVTCWRSMTVPVPRGERRALFIAAALGVTLTLLMPRGQSSQMLWLLPMVLASATAQKPQMRVATLLACAWASLCRTQFEGQDIAMAHGHAALQLWLVVYFGCFAWILFELLSNHNALAPRAAAGNKRTTWVVPRRPRRR